MSATVISGDAAAASAAEVEFVACECCGLTEECTVQYIAVVRERHGGRWICGLCAEAVKDEAYRAGILITPEEAMVRHAAFCRNFRSPEAATSEIDPAGRLIAAVRQVLRRGLDSSSSPRTTRPATSKPGGKMMGEVGPPGSCYPAVIG